MLFIPMGLLFEVGLYVIKTRSREELDIEVPERDEMVGV